MKAQKKQRKNKKFEVTPDILKQLQDSMNDTIKPDFKEKKDGKGKKRQKGPRKEKEQSPDGSAERSQSKAAV